MASTQLEAPPSYDNHGFVAAEMGAAAADDDGRKLDKHQAKTWIPFTFTLASND